ncbi:hypothetical protein IFM89_006282 [Coptis chinensis]|uniref:Uncharacterized protein n=1 Tax=Coptis chinensis TaxID=261450 RepID=A0A835GXI3_9MAGN|nr:hypothetical protein IFM89_006282 [Coptis chinensis]
MWDENGDRSVPAQCGGGKMRLLVGYAIMVSNLVLIRSYLTKEAGVRGLRKLSVGSCNFGAKGMNAVIYNCSMLEQLSVKRLRGIKKGTVSDLIAPDVAAGCSEDWDGLLEMFAENVSCLVEVHLERLQVSDRGLGAVSNCLGLEILHLVKTPECTNVGLVVIADRCKHLRKLHIDGSKRNRIGDEGLIAIARRSLRVELGLTGVKEGLSGHVVVEMRDLDNEPVVKLVGGELLGTVVAHYVIGRLVIQTFVLTLWWEMKCSMREP